MKKTRRFAALAAAVFLTTIAAMLGSASQAGAGEYDVVPAYYWTLYSDATYQTVVGHLYPDCRVEPYVYVLYTLQGSNSNYGVAEYMGSCGPGGWEPIY